MAPPHGAPPEILDATRDAYTAGLVAAAAAWPVEVRVLATAMARRLAMPRLKLGALQRELGLRDHNVASRFAVHVGMTPKQYLVHHRIELAKQMLQDERLNGLSIMQIALAVGYERTDYFSRMIKKQIGCTPSQYRYLAQLSKN